MRLESNSLDDLSKIASEIIGFSQERVFCFYGEMGAGKTTLVNRIIEVLGAEDDGSSPTFSIVNEYESDKNGTIYHFDFYRLNSEEEAYDIGYEDYVYSGNYCFIEWPEKIENLLPESYVRIDIQNQESKRVITLSLSK